jgi:fused signal recognition particle receptor
MIFWRRKKNQVEQEEEAEQDETLHHTGEPALEPGTDYEAEMDPDFRAHELEEDEGEIIDEMEAYPDPVHSAYDDALEQEAERGADIQQESGGWLSRLRQGLSKSSSKITQGLGDFVTRRKLDDEALQEIEDVLITADLGPQTASKLVQDVSDKRFGRDVSDAEIRETLAGRIAEILQPCARQMELKKPESGPRTILVTGVNGTGKTTTIGKLAHLMQRKQGKNVMMAAGDTFRAAALEQLAEWANRARVPLYQKELGADAAAVAYEAYDTARTDNRDMLLIDTAGRLHNKSHLMDELQKIKRVLGKQNSEAPHEVLLVLDATTGQNAIQQVETFKELIDISGLIVTKLDGSARGGVVVALADKFGLPIYAVGVGEKLDDLQPFRPQGFVRSLVGLDDAGAEATAESA